MNHSSPRLALFCSASLVVLGLPQAAQTDLTLRVGDAVEVRVAEFVTHRVHDPLEVPIAGREVGEQRPDGLLRITGRAKELFKTAKGKYVAPAPIENRLNAHPMVEMSLVSGVGQPAAYAVVVLAEELRPRLADAAVRRQVQSEMEQLLKAVNGSLSDHEQLHTLVIAREPWSIDNGMLTPTMKLKRSRIESALEADVERWYASRGVQWS